MRVGGDREVGVGGVFLDKILKKEGDIGNVGGLHEIRGLAPLCQLCKETSHLPNYSNF